MIQIMIYIMIQTVDIVFLSFNYFGYLSLDYFGYLLLVDLLDYLGYLLDYLDYLLDYLGWDGFFAINILSQGLSI